MLWAEDFGRRSEHHLGGDRDEFYLEYISDGDEEERQEAWDRLLGGCGCCHSGEGCDERRARGLRRRAGGGACSGCYCCCCCFGFRSAEVVPFFEADQEAILDQLLDVFQLVPSCLR